MSRSALVNVPSFSSRIGADDHDDVSVHDAVEQLRAGRRAERGFQSITGRGMTNSCAGFDVVVAEAGSTRVVQDAG